MLPERVEELFTIAARENDVSPETLEAYRARFVPSAERLTVRGETAIIPVIGPMFRRANIFTDISGATSYDMVRRDLQKALDDPSFKSIILNIDSPGGEVNGVSELADAIFAARSRKPIIAYIGGTGASGAYWIASAASEIVIDTTALLGSIGVALEVTDTTARDESRGVRRVEFISRRAPGKRPNMDSEDGRARIQRVVDDLGDIFVSAVARNRGVSETTVDEKFGQGDMLPGAKAVAAGMADRLGSFEGLISELSTAPGRGTLNSQNRRSSMSESTDAPVVEQNAGIPRADHETAVSAARAEGEKAGADSERQRLAAIVGAEGVAGNAKKMSAAMELAAKSPQMSAEDVIGFVSANVTAAPEKPEAPSASLEDRASDRDPVGEATAGGDKPTSGLSRLISAQSERLKQR